MALVRFSLCVACVALCGGLSACSDVPMATNIQQAQATASTSERLADGTFRDTFLYDEFETRAAVDVLIIDDNSDSMRNKELKLGPRLDSFLGSLGKIDWQIGITTTDTSDGTYGLKGSLLPIAGTSSPILTKNVANYQTAFNDTIVRKEALDCQNDCPSTDERPLLATIEAIQKRDSDNAGFFRPGAELAVIILSDEDEASVGGPDATQPQAVVDAFNSAFGSDKSMIGFGIIVKPGDTACFAKETLVGAHYGNTHAAFVQLTGGVLGSICDDDYGPALASIGKMVREGIKTAILSAFPSPDTLQVVVTPPDSTLTWTLVENRLTFNHPPKPGTQIVVSYKPQ